ncbi:FMN reductase [Propionicimonas paludicola]|uniref:FMN reductase n=1 Tax=Propionicimonas paludicola TaxID=185243 RepID=A0A2A9CX74_9ACTN|nr:CE1759 family FMN reductase [Propionicimonas paludicola]PFG18230.1 FMN reductase [Propionicimonas paludicola]
MTELLVVSSGTGANSSSRLLGTRLGEAAQAALAERGSSVVVNHLELRTIASDLANHLVTGLPSAKLEEAFAQVRAADGVIAVTGVYNGSYTGLFKLFFDALGRDLMRGRPVLPAATGGTARHSLVIEYAMVPLFYYLRALVSAVPVFAATADWGASVGLDARIEQAAEVFVDLVLSSHPDKTDPSFEVSDFSTLPGG